jgi:hypothetical protein
MGARLIPERTDPAGAWSEQLGAADRQRRAEAAYAGLMAQTDEPGGLERAGTTTLAPARPDPDLDEGDHDRMAHIVLEGFTPKEGEHAGEYVSAGPSVVEGIVNRTAVRALCGKEWVPGRDPARYGLCPTCKEIAESLGWQIPAR